MKSFTIKFWPLILFLGIVIFFFRSFIFGGKLPIPADTIVGMYHPFRDFYSQEYPRGVPFKNFLITDSVRQQYPWRDLATSLVEKGEWPLWNPYSFSGTPLLANFQSAAFYPLNLLFFLLPFNFSWGLLIALQPLLAGIFFYLYLRNLNLEKFACLLGAVSFSFSGFFIAWLEWGTILHSALWLPLIFLSIDKLISPPSTRKLLTLNFQPSILIWSAIFIFSLTCSFFAGHLQTFFYVGVIAVVYSLGRWWQHGRSAKIILLFTICYLLFVALAAPQWMSTLQFINLSGRGLDQLAWQKEGWFIPWQNLVQFLAPDFFGNPTTLNYWGVWNYAEFVGYTGVLPLILAIYALIWRQDKKTLFFGTLFFLSLFFAFPTFLAKIPYQLEIPFLYTSQPTRLLFLTNFSLAILAALGIDFLLKQKVAKKSIILVLLSLAVVFTGLWVFVILAPRFWPGVEWIPNLAVSKRNLILPTALFTGSFFLLATLMLKRIPKILITVGILLIVIFDLLRFGQKFTPFTKEEWLFPRTETIKFLQNQEKPFRLMTTDPRIFPPNFSIVYRLESVSGYDPLYLSRYAELIAASERREPNISPPFGFNRIITPQNFESRIIDLLNVKYVLSLNDLNSQKLKKIFQEGETRIYENQEFFPRAFLVHDFKIAETKQKAIELIFDEKIDLKKTAIFEEVIEMAKGEKAIQDEVKMVEYKEQKIVLEIKNSSEGALVLSQNFYPDWQATIDGRRIKTYRVDYNLLGILIPAGEHKVEFYPSL